MYPPIKKKHYSEVSESKKNINSDYYDIFENEFKKLFSSNQKENKQIENKQTENEQKENKQTENKQTENIVKIDINERDIFFINLFSKHIKDK